MNPLRRSVERFFVVLSDRVMLRPKLAIVLLLLLLVAVGQNLRHLEMDTELENFVSTSDPIRVVYLETKEIFGRNDMIMLGLQGDVLSKQFLETAQELQDRILYELPYVADVTSIFNAPFQRSDQDTLIVEDLLPMIPQSEADREWLRSRIEQSTLAKTMLVSPDYSMAIMIIEPQTYDREASEGDAENGVASVESFDFDAIDFDAISFEELDFENLDAEADALPMDQTPFLTQSKVNVLLDELRHLLGEYADVTSMMAGTPVMNQELERTMKSEMLFFIRLTVLLIVLVLFAFFHRPAAIIAPMAAVLSALLLTMGTMVLAGTKVQITIIMLPSFLLAITIGDAVHLLTHYYRRCAEGESRRAAMHHAIERTAIPMLLTSLTTAGGLLSLAVADVIPIQNLGIYAAYGVMLAFLLTMTLVPAIMMVVPQKPYQGSEKVHNRQLTAVVNWLVKMSQRFGGRMSLAWLLAFLLAATQVPKLVYSHDPMNWMPDDLPIIKATKTIDQKLSGSITMDVVFDTGSTNGVKSLEFMRRLDQWQREVVKREIKGGEIGGVSSIVDVVKESNRALLNIDQLELPKTEQLLIDELFLFETSATDQLSNFVDSDYRITKATIVLPWRDILIYSRFVDELRAQTAAEFEGMAKVEVTGMLALMAGTMSALIYSVAASYGLAFVVIALMMMLLLSSIRLGLVAMIPNVAPIAITMGLMVPLGIPLDMLTMLVATIAIGISVDNTVHFTHHFRSGIELGHSVDEAMQDAFMGAGQALFTTSIVLAAGFYVFLFSDVHSIFNLGFLCGTAFLLAMISNFTLTPFLLRWYFRKHQTQSQKAAVS